MICNKMKKIFSALLLMVLMVNILPTVRVFADDPSGKCGENVTYSFDESTGKLTIYVNGTMNDYSYDNKPWESYKKSIKKVTIENDVTKYLILCI